MKIYNYDAVTGEYTGAGTAQKSPLDGEWLIPAHATVLAPPAATKGHAIVWDGDKWESKPDNREQEYWLGDGTHIVIDKIGDTLPKDALDAPPDLRTLDEAKTDAGISVKSGHAALLYAASDAATPEERDTWAIKADAAYAVLNESASTAQTHMLTSEAEARGLAVQDFAAIIIAKSNAYHELVAHAAVLKAQADMAISQAKSKKAVARAVTEFDAAINTSLEALT